ncbi:MAG: hypothetical protein J6328_06105, partial [Bacilli bacterium]|nr:hypothetical protein [Bacilli bacterium]
EHGELKPLEPVAEEAFSRTRFIKDKFKDDLANMYAFTSTYLKAKKSEGKPMVVYYRPDAYADFLASFKAWLSFLPSQEEKELTFITLSSGPKLGYKVIGVPTRNIDAIRLSDLSDYVGFKYPANEMELQEEGTSGLSKLLVMAALNENAGALEELFKYKEDLKDKLKTIESLDSLSDVLLLLQNDSSKLRETQDISVKARLEKEYLDHLLANVTTIKDIFPSFLVVAINYLKDANVGRDGDYHKLTSNYRADIFVSLVKLYGLVADKSAKKPIHEIIHGMLFPENTNTDDEEDKVCRATLLQMQLDDEETKDFFFGPEKEYLLADSGEFKDFVDFAKNRLSSQGFHGDVLVEYIAALTKDLFSKMATTDDEERLFDLLDVVQSSRTGYSSTIETIFESKELGPERRLPFFFDYVASFSDEEKLKDIIREACDYFKEKGMIPLVITAIVKEVYYDVEKEAKRAILEKALSIHLGLKDAKVTNFSQLENSFKKIDELELEKRGKTALSNYFAEDYFNDFKAEDVVREVDLKTYLTSGRETFNRLIAWLKEARCFDKAKEIEKAMQERVGEVEKFEEASKNEREIFEFRKESVLTTFDSLSLDRMKETIFKFVSPSGFKKFMLSMEKSSPKANNDVEKACHELASRILSVDAEVPWSEKLTKQGINRFAIRAKFAQVASDKKMEERAALAALRDVSYRIGYATINAAITALLIIVGSLASRLFVTKGAYYAFYASFVVAGASFMWLIAFSNYKNIYGKKGVAITLLEDFLMATFLIGFYILFFMFVF